MASDDELSPKNISEVNIAAVIAIIIGIFLAIGIIVFEIQAERYSSVYITPGSYSNYVGNTPVSFVYGIHSYEKTTTEYTIVIRAGSSVVDTKYVSLKPGENYEEREIVQLPKGLAFPAKISVQTISPSETNEVHYWLRNTTASL